MTAEETLFRTKTSPFGIALLALTILIGTPAWGQTPAVSGAGIEQPPAPVVHEKPAPQLLAPPKAETPPFTWASSARFLAGAGTAFLTHETCHLATNLATGNQPGFEPVTFLGFIPFVAIVPSITCRDGECFKRNHEPYYAGRPGLYTIVSAGLQCQHYEDEIILTTRPDLRRADAPFRKGMLAFNTLLSLGYVLANVAGVEPVDGDLRGMKRDGGAPRGLAVGLVFSIAALDIARYYFPESRWLTWLSRAAKVGVTGTAFAM